MENTGGPRMSRIERLKLQAFKNFMEKKKLNDKTKKWREATRR